MKIIILLVFIFINSYGNTFLKEGTFKTVYYYGTNLKIAEKRVEECKILNEMTFAIERDCDNAKRAVNHASRRKNNSDFINQNFLK